MTDASTVLARNSRCPCGSGSRYKHCHGSRVAPSILQARLSEGLAQQLAGRFEDARRAYASILDARPGFTDAVHMLGVLDLMQGDLDSGLHRLRGAVAQLGSGFAPAVHNLALAVAGHLSIPATAASESLWLAARAPRAIRAHDSRRSFAVVVPSHNHAAYVEAAIASALAQDRLADEIIVVDDGSTDSSVATLSACARRHAGRVRLVAREARGAHAALSEAVRASSADVVAILNSDDLYAPARLRRLEECVIAAGARWGFTRSEFIGADGGPPGESWRSMVDTHRRLTDRIGCADTTGFAFLSGNVAISTGTLVFERSLFDALGGFRELRYNHDWDFALRATRLAEPVFVDEPLYRYRIHGANTILESFEHRKREADAMLRDFYADAADARDAANPFAPLPAVWGDLFWVRAIEHGHAALLPPGVVARLADRILDAIGCAA